MNVVWPNLFAMVHELGPAIADQFKAWCSREEEKDLEKLAQREFFEAKRRMLIAKYKLVLKADKEQSHIHDREYPGGLIHQVIPQQPDVETFFEHRQLKYQRLKVIKPI